MIDTHLRWPVRGGSRSGLVVAAALLMSAGALAQDTSSDDWDWDLSGRWTWTATCTTGVWKGGWSIEQSSATRFTGGYTGTNVADVGIIVKGRISGDTVSFVHKFTDVFGRRHDDRVRGALEWVDDGIEINGTSGDETFSCTFQATQ